jgi:hypothetical protein
MVAQEKSIWFGCMLAASLFALVLVGCGDVSESGSSQMAQPSKKNGPPAETAESHAAGRSSDCKPTQPDYPERAQRKANFDLVLLAE